jgi:phospholipase D1/2
MTEANVGRVTSIDASAVIVDAKAYYRAFYAAALRARRSILLAGWQFDTDAALLRGDDAKQAPLPVTLLPFLSALCERRADLVVHVLAWDYSIAYAFEREWLQDWKFSLETPERVHFEFDRHPRPTGSQHQKFVVIDGSIAFAGGADLCDERWDDRDHAAHNPLRLNALDEPTRTNHEVQAFVAGEAARFLGELFRERWREVRGEELELPPPSPEFARDFLRETSGSNDWLPLSAKNVRICRTIVNADGSVEREILRAFEQALAAAERVVFVETQYFTSRSIVNALLERLRDGKKARLELLVVLPTRGDSSKEEFAMGGTQRMVLAALEETAHATGHAIRFLCSVVDGEPSETTFIHSKVLIVDDRFLSVGSANFTERSMGFDSELALVWDAVEDPRLEGDIRRVRASLLAEHARRDASEVDLTSGLVAVVDRWLSEGSALRACHFDAAEPNVAKIRIFDPGGPDALPAVEPEPTAFEDLERFARGCGRMMRELSERLLPKS